MSRQIIIEEDVKKAGFEQYSKDLFIKKTLTGRQVRVRCCSCGRFNPEVFNVSREQLKLIVSCPYCKLPDGDWGVKTMYELPTRRLKITAQPMK